MRSIPKILERRPNAHILIIGSDGVSYGQPAPGGASYREYLLREVGHDGDWSRVHFLGHVSHAMFINILQISSAHIYLTYPFVLSWSFMEAMAAECLVIGSSTAPVMEVLKHGDNGLLVDFFDCDAIADAVDAVFNHPDRMQRLCRRARQTILDDYDLRTVTLPRYLSLIDEMLAARRPPA
jgi:glycosyltransferase involved in cell wall biosynthesis